MGKKGPIQKGKKTCQKQGEEKGAEPGCMKMLGGRNGTAVVKNEWGDGE